MTKIIDRIDSVAMRGAREEAIANLVLSYPWLAKALDKKRKVSDHQIGVEPC